MKQLNSRLRSALLLAAVLALLVSIVPKAGTAASDSGKTVTSALEIVSSYPYTTKTKVKVNLRASRSTRSTLLKKIPEGATITVKSVTKSTGWAAVDYGKYSGYVKTDYIVLKEVKKVKVTPTPTPVPSLSPEEDAGGYKVLQKGDQNNDVFVLQEALIELGYLKGTADGKFGPATEKAVIAFQQKNDYPATGIMDASIQAFLYSGKPKNASGVKTAVKTLSPVQGVSMKKGNTGSQVTALQKRLQELGYLKNVTGTYDTNTISAVRSFQKKNGILSNGTADLTTQNAIYADSAVPASATATPKPTKTPKPTEAIVVPTASLRSGDKGTDVKTVQKRLKELGYYKSTIDGKFGKTTVSALKAFQEAHGLEADGVAGKATYAVLFGESALKKGATPTPKAPDMSTAKDGSSWVTLRKNDKGENVAELQEALIKLGYLNGKADGNYGDKTVAAVKAFQKANGLTVDGSAGAETQSVLYNGGAKAANAKATATPKTTAKATATPAPSNTLKSGSKGSAVKELQQKLIQLGFLKGSADGVYGQKTVAAVKAFQKANKLSADGVAGSKTLSKLQSSGGSSTSTKTTSSVPASASKPSASRVQYANWYDKVKSVAKKYPYATVFDISTGISWQVHIFSVGAHADCEPVTANDTARLVKVFGGNTWTPRAVWVVFSDGSVYIASTHSMPHEVQHIRDNNFAGHTCIHFPRTQEQVTKIGPYATKHQETIDKGWSKTLSMK